MKEYSSSDAAVRIFLENIQKGVYLLEHYLDSEFYEVGNKFYLLVVNEEHILFINIADKTLIWERNTNDLDTVEKFRNGLKLNYREV